MSEIRIELLGELSVWRNEEPVKLPPSKKTRALLAYLVLTNRPHRRDRLCEVFWEVPEDPRGALRWSLSRLRSVVNSQAHQHLVADRERVAWQANALCADLVQIGQALENDALPYQQLQQYDAMLREPLLFGLDLPNQHLFQQWLTGERLETERFAAIIAQRLCEHPEATARERVDYATRWLALEPADAKASDQLVRAMRETGQDEESIRREQEIRARLQNAGAHWIEDQRAPVEQPHTELNHDRQSELTVATRRLLTRQRIRFCSAADGTRIAYASVGEGPPLVKAANWLNHLELDWRAPIWSPLFQQLARDFELIRYDERGNGLSDWDVDEISPAVFSSDLETVIEAAGLDRFALLGISQGASVSIDYAVNHPERVSHLVLFGSYAAGWRIDATPAEIKEREAIMTLTRSGWGRNNPAYRQIFSSTFLPSATAEELHWFNEFQRQTTSPDNAVRFLSAFGDIDVRDKLANVSVPTLVIHSRGDRRIPIESAREIAATIPNAEFLTLDSDNHLLLGREPASEAFVGAVREFLSS